MDAALKVGRVRKMVKYGPAPNLMRRCQGCIEICAERVGVARDVENVIKVRYQL